MAAARCERLSHHPQDQRIHTLSDSLGTCLLDADGHVGHAASLVAPGVPVFERSHTILPQSLPNMEVHASTVKSR